MTFWRSRIPAGRRAVPGSAAPPRGTADRKCAWGLHEARRLRHLGTRQLDAVESALDACVPADAPAGLGEAMRYSRLDGGKRLRPLLVLAAAEACGGARRAAAACAVELVHAYSLVHDDLPCMDDDDLRRGRPTTHDPSAAPGDPRRRRDADARLRDPRATTTASRGAQARLCGLLALAAGGAGIRRPGVDLAGVGLPARRAELDMHRMKTGALLRASVLMGAASGAHDPRAGRARRLRRRARPRLQIIDDILDVTQASATLGKTAGKDLDNNKPTYVTVLGLDAAHAHAEALRRAAHAALDGSGIADTEQLRELADRVVARES